MANWLSGLAGIAKLGSNFLGGGAGSSSSGKTSGSQSSKTTSSTTADRQEFSDGMLQLLESITANGLANSGQSQDNLGAQSDLVADAKLGAKPATNFDPDAYVRGIVSDATSRVNGQLESDTNAAVSNAGGSSGSNSTAALLANRLRTDAAASLAGVTANANASAAQIATGLREQQVNELASGTNQLATLDTSMAGHLATLLSNLKGGETFQTVASNEATSSSSKGTTSTTTPFNWTKGLGNIFADIDQGK